MTDAIDLSTVTILNSPDVRAWPATADITRIAASATNTQFTFTKQSGAGAWPAQPFGDAKNGDNCQYTVWLLLLIGGQWFGAGFINMWQGRDGVGDGISDYVTNWLLAGRGWDQMVGHVIEPGDTIGFMLTAGNARMNGESSVHERSNVVAVVVPAGYVGVFDFADAPAPPAPAPVPVPTPPVAEDILALIDELLTVGHAFVDALNANTAELKNLQGTGLRVHL